MKQCECELYGRHYILDVEPAEFGWEFTRGTKGDGVLVLSWCYRTHFRNIVLLTLATIRLKPPFLRISKAVLDLDEPVDEDER